MAAYFRLELIAKFVLLYNSETQKQVLLARERDMLDTQLHQAQTELATMQQMQENAATYRHDMRHHIAYLRQLANEERIGDIKAYLNMTESDIDAITPVRYCENNTVNLILSTFAAKAKQAGTRLSMDAKLPDTILFSDTELCSLLSNELENAIQACDQITAESKREIKLRIYSKNNKLCIDIRNRYQSEPVFREGLPVAREQGHGYGTKSMVHIVEKHGGVCRFSVKDGWFVFQATA